MPFGYFSFLMGLHREDGGHTVSNRALVDGDEITTFL